MQYKNLVSLFIREEEQTTSSILYKEFLIICREKCLHRKSGQALEQAAQGGGGVTIPGGV